MDEAEQLVRGVATVDGRVQVTMASGYELLGEFLEELSTFGQASFDDLIGGVDRALAHRSEGPSIGLNARHRRRR